jgi:hypothetical protein
MWIHIEDCQLPTAAVRQSLVESYEGDQLNLTIFQNVLQRVIEGDVVTLGEEKVAEALLLFKNVNIKYNTNTFVVIELEV